MCVFFLFVFLHFKCEFYMYFESAINIIHHNRHCQHNRHTLVNALVSYSIIFSLITSIHCTTQQNTVMLDDFLFVGLCAK